MHCKLSSSHHYTLIIILTLALVLNDIEQMTGDILCERQNQKFMTSDLC